MRKINVYEKGIRGRKYMCKSDKLKEERGDKDAEEMTFHPVIKAMTR
jgi:hypothetical protein